MECETINPHLTSSSQFHEKNDLFIGDSELKAFGLKRRSKIDSIRKMFQEDYEANRELYDDVDYQKVMSKDFWITRYMANIDDDSGEVIERIKSAMRWRKSFGINQFDPLIMPKEFFQIAALIPYKPDRQGRPTLYIRGKMHRKVHQLEERVKQFLAYQINKVDGIKEAHESWLLIIDATDASFINTDMDMIMFLFQTLRLRFPQGVAHAFIFGLPWILGAFANMVLSVLPSDSVSKIKFGGKKELFELVGEENVPDFLGGSCKRNYRRVPRKAASCMEVGVKELGLTQPEIEKLLRPFRQFIHPELCEEVDELD